MDVHVVLLAIKTCRSMNQCKQKRIIGGHLFRYIIKVKCTNIKYTHLYIYVHVCIVTYILSSRKQPLKLELFYILINDSMTVDPCIAATIIPRAAARPEFGRNSRAAK